MLDEEEAGVKDEMSVELAHNVSLADGSMAAESGQSC